MRYLIAFGGKMGSGKDTAADYLCEKHGGCKHSFASPLYKILKYSQQICGFEDRKDRKFLQFVGTDWARSEDPDVWLNVAVRDTPSKGNVFLTDIRFGNELRTLKKESWFCVRLDREHQVGREGTGLATHSSEQMIGQIPSSEWDLIIKNNGTVDQLYEKLDKMMITIKCS